MARKPYVELPDILKLLPPLEPVDTEPEVGGPGGLLNQSKDQNISSYILRGGWYDDGSFIPSRLVLLEEPFEIELDITDITFNEQDELRWEILQDGQVIHSEGGSPSKSFTMSDYVTNSQVQSFEIRAVIDVYRDQDTPGGIEFILIRTDVQPEIAFTAVPTPEDEADVLFTPVYEPFVAKITSVEGDTIGIDSSYQSIVQRIQPITEGSKLPNEQYTNWVISNKFGERKN